MIRIRMWYACIYAAGKKKKAKKRAKPAASPRWAQTGPAKSQWKVKGQEPREPFCHSISDSSVRVVRNFRRTRSPLRLIHTTIVPPPLSFVQEPSTSVHFPPPRFRLLLFHEPSSLLLLRRAIFGRATPRIPSRDCIWKILYRVLIYLCNFTTIDFRRKDKVDK